MTFEQVITVLGLVGGLAYLLKLRHEENLRTRLALASEMYEAFSNLNEAVRSWALPFVVGNEDKYARLGRELSELSPKALSAFHRASLIMPPEIRATLHRIFDQIGRLDAEYQNYLMFKESNASSPGAYVQEMKEAFDGARKTLPAEIDAAHKKLRRDLEVLVNGSLKAWRWRRQARKLEKANAAAKAMASGEERKRIAP